MRFRNLLTLGSLALTLSACASLNSVSITPIPAERKNQVSAQAERWIILGFNFDNDYADRVSSDLSQRCPHGKVSGILTKDESYMYFLFFVMKHKVTATGYCASTYASAGESSGVPSSLAKPASRGRSTGRRVNSEGAMSARRLIITLAALTAVGCTHSTHLVHVGDFDPTYAPYARGQWVTAESETIRESSASLRTPSYVDQAFERLKAQCPGTVQGLQTEYSTDHGFFSWTNRIRIQGLCLKKLLGFFRAAAAGPTAGDCDRPRRATSSR